MSIIIRDLLKLRKETGELGVEIEVEGVSIPRETLKYWKREEDGSLRGESGEFVLRKPLKFNDVVVALAELEAAYVNNDTIVHDSIRAGVHVHVNVQELTINQLISFITTYVILENLLVKWCGKTREGNLFCLRCKDAEAWLQALETAIDRMELSSLKQDAIRYASINLKALCQYGSLEFRSMRGTRDLSQIAKWASVLKGVKDFSLTYDTPIQVMEDCLNDVGSFVQRALGEHYADFIYEGYMADVEVSIRYANDLAHFSDWKDVVMKLIGELPFPETVMFPDEPNEDF